MITGFEVAPGNESGTISIVTQASEVKSAFRDAKSPQSAIQVTEHRTIECSSVAPALPGVLAARQLSLWRRSRPPANPGAVDSNERCAVGLLVSRFQPRSSLPFPRAPKFLCFR